MYESQFFVEQILVGSRSEKPILSVTLAAQQDVYGFIEQVYEQAGHFYMVQEFISAVPDCTSEARLLRREETPEVVRTIFEKGKTFAGVRKLQSNRELDDLLPTEVERRIA